MISKELSEAAVEINVILENTSPEIVNKIPKKFRDFLKEIASKTYEFNYDDTKLLEEQNIKPKTKGLLALIYKDFLCEEHEKQEYINKAVKVMENIEQIKREKYNPDDIFKKANKDTETANMEISENNSNTALIEYKESFFTRFKNFILKVLHINQ